MDLNQEWITYINGERVFDFPIRGPMMPTTLFGPNGEAITLMPNGTELRITMPVGTAFRFGGQIFGATRQWRFSDEPNTYHQPGKKLSRLEKLQNLANDTRAPDGERAAAQEAIRRLTVNG